MRILRSNTLSKQGFVYFTHYIDNLSVVVRNLYIEEISIIKQYTVLYRLFRDLANIDLENGELNRSMIGL